MKEDNLNTKQNTPEVADNQTTSETGEQGNETKVDDKKKSKKLTFEGKGKRGQAKKSHPLFIIRVSPCSSVAKIMMAHFIIHHISSFIIHHSSLGYCIPFPFPL